jgi:8-oxo-dGTP pyrophosphatase MutT (NUDIX family)
MSPEVWFCDELFFWHFAVLFGCAVELRHDEACKGLSREGEGTRMRSESAGGVVFDARRRIAIVLQRNREGRLRWTLPKGKLEPGETPGQAARREVLEETGLRTRIVGRLGTYQTKRRRTYWFRMDVRRNHGVFDDETAELRFVSVARARRLVRSRRDRTVLAWALAQAAAGAPSAATRRWQSPARRGARRLSAVG